MTISSHPVVKTRIVHILAGAKQILIGLLHKTSFENLDITEASCLNFSQVCTLFQLIKVLFLCNNRPWTSIRERDNSLVCFNHANLIASCHILAKQVLELSMKIGSNDFIFFPGRFGFLSKWTDVQCLKQKMRIVPYDLWTSMRSTAGHQDVDDYSLFRPVHRRCWTKVLKLHRKCACTSCNEDKRVQEFFTKRRYWWTSRTL